MSAVTSPTTWVMWGGRDLNPTAVKEATKIRYPMGQVHRRVVGRRRRYDARDGGAEAKGYKTLNSTSWCADLPCIPTHQEAMSWMPARARRLPAKFGREPLQSRRAQTRC